MSDLKKAIKQLDKQIKDTEAMIISTMRNIQKDGSTDTLEFMLRQDEALLESLYVKYDQINKTRV